MSDPLVVYAVVYSNYEPAEVDSLWMVKADAEKRRDHLNEEALGSDTWEVAAWTVHPPEMPQEGEE